jgi:methyl-accepting chemotaxis protein
MHFKAGLHIGFIIAAVGFCVASFYSGENFITLSNKADLALEIANSATAVKETLLDAETGTRGYIITGNEAYLKPYNDATQRIDANLNALNTFAAKDPVEAHNVIGIDALAHQKMDILANVNTIRHDKGFEASKLSAFVKSGVGPGQRVMDTIRVLVTTIQVNEAYNNNQYQSQSKNWGELTILSTICFAVSAILAVLWYSMIMPMLELHKNHKD